MVRVKRGKATRKKRRRLFKKVKGFRWGRKRRLKLAKDALRHAWAHAYRDRKRKKREMRRLQQIQIGAACRQQGISYSRFIGALKKNKIELDRKILAKLAQHHPEIFQKIIEKTKESAK
jgi:large subunit ribosomal protein L20